MKSLGRFCFNLGIFLLVTMLLAALQCSLWLQLFGWFPAPQLWLTILVFWVLYRELWEGIVMMYLLAIVVTTFSSLPFPHVLVLNLLTCMTLVFGKKRVYWSGSTFFMLATGAATISFIVYEVALSWRFDNNPIRDWPILGWLFTILLTMLLSLPLHRIFSWLDVLTGKEHPTEAGTGVL